MKIILTGFMGSGKSSVATALGKELSLNVIEMDALVLERTKSKNMAEVFNKGGELLLREWEIILAKEWQSAKNVIISTGGGVVMNKIILDYLKINSGIVIFLDSSFEAISDRIKIGNTPRPLFQDVEIARKLYTFRLPLYKKYADIIIKTDTKKISKIVKEIVVKLK